MQRSGRRLAVGALVVASVALTGCPDGNTPTVSDSFAYLVVNEVLSVSGGAHTWLIELDLENQEGNGTFFLRFEGGESCISESPMIYVLAGRNWTDEYNVNCVEQPQEVIAFSLREGGFVVTDRDSIPLLPQP